MKQYTPIDFTKVDINGGFWKRRQQINRDTTVYTVERRFEDTGRFATFRFDWKEGEPNKPDIYWDSDVAKWMEAVAYLLEKGPAPDLEKKVDDLVDLIVKNQDPNGYFNVFFTVVKPEERFLHRTDHELYCAGHLIEAAVAYAHATGKTKFLDAMCRYADLIEQVFVKDRSAAFITPGHEEIELALVKLYRYTGEKRYLDLSKFFIDHRGEDPEEQYYGHVNGRHCQDHLPVREQKTAEGHAVRAAYLYAGMADVAYETDDQTLYDACNTLFDNIVERRMYITGGIGSEAYGEGFTLDYDLPNKTAYNESCASIAMIFFARRMWMLNADSRYADIAERVLYNGFLSSETLDGNAFFYENPLEIDPKLRHRNTAMKDTTARFPITQRVEVFGCSCCPPNITRFMASVGDLLYTTSDDTLFVHQYIQSSSAFDWAGKEVKIAQDTRYPIDGKIAITLEGDGLNGRKAAVRIPGWCKEYTISVNGAPFSGTPEKGYLYIPCGDGKTEVILDFVMKPVLMEASSHVQEDAGRVALQRGPVVYCLEGVDNGDDLRALAVDRSLALQEEYDEFFDGITLTGKGWRKAPSKELYAPVDDSLWQEQTLKFIPYYGFANRGETEMIVWIQAR